MRFEVEVERLIDAGISIEDYFFLQFVSQQNRSVLDLYMEQFDRFFTKDSLERLISLDYLSKKDQNQGFTINNLKVTKKYNNHFGDLEVLEVAPKKSVDRVEDWIDVWRALFPKGVKNGIYSVKSSKPDCLDKMKKFMKRYPEYDKEIIMKATEDYVKRAERNNYAYMQLAKYFIIKDNTSALADLCEEIKEKLDSGENISNISDFRDNFTRSLN